jgi:hypothetical protein
MAGCRNPGVVSAVVVAMTDAERELERIERIADLLDAEFAVPGTSIRFGLDSLFGLVPALGDAAGLLASLYVMKRLSALGLPAWTRHRMLLNIAADAAGGTLPLLGDIFDVAFKANRRNIALARRALEKAGRLGATLELKARVVEPQRPRFPGKSRASSS